MGMVPTTPLAAARELDAAIFAFGNAAATRSEAEALHQAAVTHLQAENREDSAPRNISCTRTMPNVCSQSHGVREYEARVSAKFHAEGLSDEARISRVCQEQAQAPYDAEFNRRCGLPPRT